MQLGEGTYNYFTLSFSFDFDAHSNDELWFAHSIPYTFSDMNKKLAHLRDSPSCQSILRLDLLGLSLAKLPVPILTITEQIDSYLSYADEVRLIGKIPASIRKKWREMYRQVSQLVLQAR